MLGPRRVGKTVLLHQCIRALLDDGVAPRSIAYLSVDHPLYNGLGLHELLEHIEDAIPRPDGDRLYLFLDEIQYLREWERHLKVLVDARRDVEFVVSGSAAAALRLKSLESGAGRFTDFLLPPLTFFEYLRLRDLEAELIRPAQNERWPHVVDIGALNDAFFDYINFGGYPEIALSSSSRQDPARYIRSDIIDKVLLRDLPSLYGIHDVKELNSLFTSIAYNSAQEISLQGLAQRAGISKATIKRYIEYLDAAFLIRTVSRVDYAAKHFKREHFFKVYLTNPSLRAGLFTPIDDTSESAGSSVETAVFAQWFHADRLDLHYARWKTGEVDIVQLGPVPNRADAGVRWVAEIKWTNDSARDPRGLKALYSFCRKHEVADAVVTTVDITDTATGDDGFVVRFVPAAVYCYELGKNIIRGAVEDVAPRTGSRRESTQTSFDY